jgi:ATP-dependent helicase/DNAse subunit B
VKALNVTMGFPLLSTPLYSLLTSLLEMQQSAVVKEGQLTFYFKPLLQVLQHPLINHHAPEEVRTYIAQIEQRNQTKVALVAETETPLYKLLFVKCATVHELLAYLNQIIVMLFDEADRELDSLEKEYAYQFYTQLNRIKEVFLKDELQLSITAFIKLFTQIITSHRIPFSGEPLKGLQVMGVLETRNLDFDNVYVLSMNEGMFPAQASQHSFVPYNLRKAYGLPTYDQQDSMYSYLFYRLIQKAKNVHLFYNTVEEKGGELSRLVQQLMMESDHKIQHNVWSPEATLTSIEPITIQKTAPVLQNLEKYVVSDQTPFKRLTPSALSIYLDCRLKFYYRYVAQIYEYDSIQTEIDPMVFGNILHNTMELLYKPYTGKSITPEDNKAILDSLKGVIDQAFLTHYLVEEETTFDYEGKLIIARDIVNKYVRKIVALDMEYAPFEVLGLEESEGYALDLTIDSGKQIGLKGIIDRIDKKDGIVRVIDYKTGQDDKVLTSIESLFDRDDKKRNKAAMQTFFYALLYANKNPDADNVVPGIFNSKEMFSKDFDYHLKMQGEKPTQKTPVYNALPYLEEFKLGLTNLLEELYSPKVAFDQTEDLKKCSYCPYTEICGR